MKTVTLAEKDWDAIIIAMEDLCEKHNFRDGVDDPTAIEYAGILKRLNDALA